MADLTFTIEPDEFLGLSALVVLDRAADGGDAYSDTGADAVSKARTLMRTALSDKLEKAGLPWAPPEGAVKERAAEAAQRPGAMRALTGDKKLRRDAVYVLALALLVVLWGGYVRRWDWTGFDNNNQLWDWLQLLLVPVAVGTIPLGSKTGSTSAKAGASSTQSSSRPASCSSSSATWFRSNGPASVARRYGTGSSCSCFRWR